MATWLDFKSAAWIKHFRLDLAFWSLTFVSLCSFPSLSFSPAAVCYSLAFYSLNWLVRFCLNCKFESSLSMSVLWKLNRFFSSYLLKKRPQCPPQDADFFRVVIKLEFWLHIFCHTTPPAILCIYDRKVTVYDWLGTDATMQVAYGT